MKRLLWILAAALLVSTAAAAAPRTLPGGSVQTPQVTNVRQSVDSVPQMTLVPVQQPPVQAVDYTTRFETPGEGLNRVERRALRAKNYAAALDSLVQSRNYLFFPATMQEMPDGAVRTVYADYFFLGIFADHVELHLPVDRGVSQYLERLNFDSMAISNYQLSRTQCGWMASCNIADGETNYHACLMLSTATGDATLLLITPSVTMRYTGWVSDRFGRHRPNR